MRDTQDNLLLTMLYPQSVSIGKSRSLGIDCKYRYTEFGQQYDIFARSGVTKDKVNQELRFVLELLIQVTESVFLSIVHTCMPYIVLLIN